MLYVLLRDGTVDEVAGAVSTNALGGALACKDERGRLLKTYDRHSVIMFGHDERVKQLADTLREPQ